MAKTSTQALPTPAGKWFEIGQQFLESTARGVQHLDADPNGLREACGELLEAARGIVFEALDFQRTMLEEWRRSSSKLPLELGFCSMLADVTEKGIEARAILWRAWFQTAQQLQWPDSAESLWRALSLPAEALIAAQHVTPDTTAPAKAQDSTEDSSQPRRRGVAQARGS